MANGNLSIIYFGNLVNGADVQRDAVGESRTAMLNVKEVTASIRMILSVSVAPD